MLVRVPIQARKGLAFKLPLIAGNSLELLPDGRDHGLGAVDAVQRASSLSQNVGEVDVDNAIYTALATPAMTTSRSINDTSATDIQNNIVWLDVGPTDNFRSELWDERCGFLIVLIKRLTATLGVSHGNAIPQRTSGLLWTRPF